MTIDHRTYDLISVGDNIGSEVLNPQDRQSSDPSAVDAFSPAPPPRHPRRFWTRLICWSRATQPPSASTTSIRGN